MNSTILLIDDCPAIHSLLQAQFGTESITLHSAFDGPSGLRMIGRLNPDLVLLDVEMPELNGFEVCRQIRENPFTLNTPVIFLTASGDIAQKVNGLELGAQDYIVKPFECAELVARVRASLRMKARLDSLVKDPVSQFSRIAPVRRKAQSI